MKWKICLLAFLWPFMGVFAQSNKPRIPVESLQVGDKIPDGVWTLPFTTVNHPEGKRSITLNDHRGKLIILDFWSTWCGSCIAGIPKLDSLQNQFRGRIKILPVTTQRENEVRPFILKNDLLKGSQLPFIVGDSSLKRLFPHRMIPHLAWIDTDGNFLGSTWAEDANATTINALLSGNAVTFKAPKQDQLDYDFQKPLFFHGNGGNGDNTLYRSLITKYVNGIPGMVGGQSTEKSFRIYVYNGRLTSLYKHAVNRNRWSNNRVFLEGEKVQKYRIDDWDREKYTKGFCYELIVPADKEENAYKIMLQDLNRFFGLHGRIEKRKIWCWFLVQKSDAAKLLQSKGGKPVFKFRPTLESRIVINNKPLILLTERLNRLLPLPLIDKTTYKGNVDMILRANLKSIDLLRRELQKYGLDLRKDQQELDILVISGDDQG